VADRIADLERYHVYLENLGVSEWVQLDLSIVRGLAYYTGIVFELFDARGEFRAICGGGRYDSLLNSLGDVDLPALGFGMGDVVLGELLRARGLSDVPIGEPDFWVAAADGADLSDVMLAATQLRRAGASAEYALRPQTISKQRKAAFSAGATYFVTIGLDFRERGTLAVDEVQHVEGADDSLVERFAELPPTIASLTSLVRGS
jgi:histidyl-tRNA synthetase